MKFALKMVLMTLAAGMLSSCESDDNPVHDPHGRPDEVLYVLNQTDGTVYVLDATTLDRVDSLSAQIANPHHMEFSPDAQYAYIVSRGDATTGKLAKLDLATDSIIGVAQGPQPQLSTAIAISATGDTGFVTDFNGIGAAAWVHRYNLSTMTYLDSAIRSGSRAHDVKILPSGSTVFTANFSSDDVTFFNTFSGDIEQVRLSLTQAPPYYGPYGLAIDETRNRLYVACRTSDQVLAMDLTTRTVVDSVAVPGPLATEAGPCQMVLSPDGSKLYVTTQNDSALAVIDAISSPMSLSVQRKFSVLMPFGVHTNLDGSRIYVACVNAPNQAGWIFSCDAAGNVLDSAMVGKNSYMVHYHSHESHGGH